MARRTRQPQTRGSSTAGQSREEHVLRTFMSPVFHKAPLGSGDNLLPFPGAENQTYLLDDLLGGGIVIPNHILQALPPAGGTGGIPPQTDHRGLFVLLTGPPGSGKSTFALELCYRLAIHPNEGLGGHATDGISSIYISTESATDAIRQNAESFGWGRGTATDAARERLLRARVREEDGEKCVDVERPRISAPPYHVVSVFGREFFGQLGKSEPAHAFLGKMDDLLGELRTAVLGPTGPEPHPCPAPLVVVFDSLNVVPLSADPNAILGKLTDACPDGAIVVVAMIEEPSGFGDGEPRSGAVSHRDFWPFYADVVIRFGQDVQLGYMTRSVQILKARYQDHADGKHRLKINHEPGEEAIPYAMAPLTKEGGIFVFPSIHRRLSIARRVQKSRLAESVPTPFRDLNDIIQSRGLPPSACTAVVGSRGGMKSHLAYYTLLRFLSENAKKRAVIISLRDDERAATDTLAQIVANQRDENGEYLAPGLGGTQKQRIDKAEELVRAYQDQDRLEILFFWPGYIPPEEFFHLVLVAVDRKPSGGEAASLVVINGLEQLGARFPLCAREEMFVSGLITLLRSEGLTSIVVSGGEPSNPPGQGGVLSGLLPMADLIIESSFRILPSEAVWSEQVWGSEMPGLPRGTRHGVASPRPEGADQRREAHVIYQVVRGPGARECRRRVLFYMGRDGQSPPLYPGSVIVKALPEDFPYGEKL